MAWPRISELPPPRLRPVFMYLFVVAVVIAGCGPSSEPESTVSTFVEGISDRVERVSSPNEKLFFLRLKAGALAEDGTTPSTVMTAGIIGEVDFPDLGCVSPKGDVGAIWPPGTRFGRDGRSLEADGALLVDGTSIEGSGGEVTPNFDDADTADCDGGSRVWTEVNTIDWVGPGIPCET